MSERIMKGTYEFEQLRAQALFLRTEKRMTIAQIADALNISRYQVRGLLTNENGRLPRKHTYKAVYPRLEAWAMENYESISACAMALGIRNTALEQIIYWGGVYTRKCVIDRILALSGMTYEEAFEEAKTA